MGRRDHDDDSSLALVPYLSSILCILEGVWSARYSIRGADDIPYKPRLHERDTDVYCQEGSDTFILFT